MTELDQATICVGLPKFGKSTIVRKEALEFLNTYPTGFVFAHDKHRVLAQPLAGGKPDIARVYETPADWRKAVAAGQHTRASSFVRCTSEEVARLAIEVGERHNRDIDVKIPIKLIYEERAHMSTSGSTHMSELDFMLFSDRRHLGLAPHINVQRQSSLMAAFYEMATDVFVFAQTEKNARALEEKLSLPEGALQPVVNAPKFHYLHWRQGEGIVDE